MLLFLRVPPGFVPQQDKQYLIGIAQLPEGASLARTTEVIERLSSIAKGVPGVRDSVAFPGLSINGFTAAPNSGILNNWARAWFGWEEFDYLFDIYTIEGVAFCIACYAFPYVFTLLAGALDSIPSDQEDASRVLGAGAGTTWIR